MTPEPIAAICDPDEIAELADVLAGTAALFTYLSWMLRGDVDEARRELMAGIELWVSALGRRSPPNIRS